ncbi:hypothetical protein ANN_23683 [Periplaneta americana]|uniref:Uncharacterized protein n=1 Tax=Periplaneta americana TaxID=6978 RepID=A0ABQ8SM83_PERAM|nr:hypothetical protein ANN_23683 [Periplaneta americana]
MRKHMKLDLKLRCWSPLNVNELSDGDLERRVDACGRMLQQCPTLAQQPKAMISEECAIYRSSRSRNVFFGEEKIHIYLKKSSAIHHMP